MAAVSGMHRFQAGCARLPMPARSGVTVPFTLFFGSASKLYFSTSHFLTNCFPFLVLYDVYCSGLAVLYLGHSE